MIPNMIRFFVTACSAMTHREIWLAVKRISNQFRGAKFRFGYFRRLSRYLSFGLAGSNATRIHFIQPLKERIVREVGYGLSVEGASAADLVKSMQAKSEPAAQKKSA